MDELGQKLAGLDLEKKDEEAKVEAVDEDAPKKDAAEEEDQINSTGGRKPEIDTEAGPIMGFFACQPIKECPHCLPENISPIEDFKDLTVTTPCQNCDHKKENWVCLKCRAIMCSRYVKSHMVEHYEKEKHPIALSFADFSFWCYECDSYVVSKHLNHVKHFYPQKFGDEEVGII